MEPYTPRTRTGGRKKNITLSAKEYTKVGSLKDIPTFTNFSQITGTIASVRRSRLSQVDDLEPEEDRVQPKATGRHYNYTEQPSFIAETSFVRAPLNSRVSSISISNNVPKAKGKAKQETLDNVPIDIQEAMILEDLLYVLMVSTLVGSNADR